MREVVVTGVSARIGRAVVAAPVEAGVRSRRLASDAGRLRSLPAGLVMFLAA